MKKLYTFIFITTFALINFNANATKNYVTVGVGTGGTNFSPATSNVMVGDTMVWTLVSGVHTVTSISVPTGAATFDSGTMSTAGGTFTYPILVAGTYAYKCTYHFTSGMVGGFQASGAGITDPTRPSITSAFPNPCVDKLIFKYNGIDNISVYNVVGEQVKSEKVIGNEGTLEMNMEDMPSGIYFYRTYKDGLVYETRKIVKAK